MPGLHLVEPFVRGSLRTGIATGPRESVERGRLVRTRHIAVSALFEYRLQAIVQGPIGHRMCRWRRWDRRIRLGGSTGPELASLSRGASGAGPRPASLTLNSMRRTDGYSACHSAVTRRHDGRAPSRGQTNLAG